MSERTFAEQWDALEVDLADAHREIAAARAAIREAATGHCVWPEWRKLPAVKRAMDDPFSPQATIDTWLQSNDAVQLTRGTSYENGIASLNLYRINRTEVTIERRGDNTTIHVGDGMLAWTAFVPADQVHRMNEILAAATAAIEVNSAPNA